MNENMNIITKGNGAGGCNTNKNGLSYETLTDLKNEYSIIEKNKFHNVIIFHSCSTKYISTNQSKLFKYMINNTNTNIVRAHGCKNPDECYIDENKKIIFIIEKKFQQVGGSVCEKIQTPDFKLWQYNRTFPEYEIVYIYCLSDWFKTNCISELEYLKYKNIPVFWGNNINYKKNIISFITNYK